MYKSIQYPDNNCNFLLKKNGKYYKFCNTTLVNKYSKIRDYSEKKKNIMSLTEKPISKIYRIFITKFKNKSIITPNQSEKSSSGFCSILINDFYHSILNN